MWNPDESSAAASPSGELPKSQLVGSDSVWMGKCRTVPSGAVHENPRRKVYEPFNESHRNVSVPCRTLVFAEVKNCHPRVDPGTLVGCHTPPTGCQIRLS